VLVVITSPSEEGGRAEECVDIRVGLESSLKKGEILTRLWIGCRSCVHEMVDLLGHELKM
jgi:hypothetical protein